MKTFITFKQIDSSDTVKDYIIEKSERVEKYDLRAMELHVTLNKVKHLLMAEVEVIAKDFHGHCEGSSEDVYSSIDQGLHKMEKILQKRTTRMKRARTAKA